MKISKSLLFCFIITVVLITSCQQSNYSSIKKPTEVNIPKDRTAITGFVVKGKNSEPVSEIVVRLGEVIWNNDKSDGSFIIDGANSPSTITDDQGFFILNDIDIKDYIIVLGNLEESPIVVVKKENKEKAEIYSPEVNKELFIGFLNLDDY